MMSSLPAPSLPSFLCKTLAESEGYPIIDGLKILVVLEFILWTTVNQTDN